MEDKTIQVITEVTKEVVKDAYGDLKPIVEPAAELVGLLPRAIKAALAPLERWIMEREYNLAETKKLLEQKLANIPLEQIVTPEAYVAVPALQAISYCMDSEELRNMFASLLARSMNAQEKQGVHPAYVEIIKQLSPFDARFLKLFCYRNTFPGLAVVEKHIDGKLTPYIHNAIELFEYNDFFEITEQFSLTATIDNLMRLGLIKKNHQIIELNYDYNLLKEHFFYKACEKSKDSASSLNTQKYRIELTELGRAFKECCLE